MFFFWFIFNGFAFLKFCFYSTNKILTIIKLIDSLIRRVRIIDTKKEQKVKWIWISGWEKENIKLEVKTVYGKVENSVFFVSSCEIQLCVSNEQLRWAQRKKD